MNLAALNNKIDNAVKVLKAFEVRLRGLESVFSSSHNASKSNSLRDVSLEGKEHEFQAQWKSKLHSLQHRAFRVTSKLLAWAVVVLALVTGYIQLRYDVSIVPYSSLNSPNPFQSEFLVTNEGPFSIYNVYYFCFFEDLVGDNGPLSNYVVPVPYSLPALRPHGQYAISCKGVAPYSPHVKDGAAVEIHVSYRPKFSMFESRGGALFYLRHDDAGNVVWLPRGDAPKKPGDLKVHSCVSCEEAHPKE